MQPGNGRCGRDNLVALTVPFRPVSWGLRPVLRDLETRTVGAALYSSKIHGVNQNSFSDAEFGRWSSALRGLGDYDRG